MISYKNRLMCAYNGGWETRDTKDWEANHNEDGGDYLRNAYGKHILLRDFSFLDFRQNSLWNLANNTTILLRSYGSNIRFIKLKGKSLHFKDKNHDKKSCADFDQYHLKLSLFQLVLQISVMHSVPLYAMNWSNVRIFLLSRSWIVLVWDHN